MTPHYATYFDRHFLTRGLALIGSIRRHAGAVPMTVLCLDDDTHVFLSRLGLPNVRLLSLAQLEAADPELAAVRSTRTTLEYYFTVTAPFLRHLFAVDPSIETLTYVDADHFFFGDPAPIYAELDDRTIAIIDHRYPPAFADNYVYGRFNVGILVFRRSGEADACLARWREQCLDWCYDRLEEHRYGDQKYLDEWPERYAGLRVLEYPGVGLALWNVPSYTWSSRGGRVYVDGVPLMTYHFSRFRIITPWLFDVGARWFGYSPHAVLRYGVYAPYARAVQRATRLVDRVGERFGGHDTVRAPNGRFSRVILGAALEKAQVLGAAGFRRGLLLVHGRIAL